MSTPIRLILILIVGAIVVQWLAAGLIGFCTDSGYYVPMAQAVARGHVPIADFPTHYSPGSYYMMALLGNGGLSNSAVLRVFMFVLGSLSSWMIYVILRRRNDHWHSLFLATLFFAWSSSLQGKWAILEPFQNLYLIASWLILIRWPSLRGVAFAGLCAGMALMMKQYSLLAVPGLALLALCPTQEWPWRLPSSERKQAAIRLALFAVAIPLPFAIFVLATGQSLVAAFLALSSWGGEAAGYSVPFSLSRLRMLLESILVGPNIALLLPIAGMWAWLMWMRPSWQRLALGGIFFASFLPLVIRNFPHYFLLILPWAILILSDFTREMGREYAPASHGDEGPRRLQELLVGVATLGLLPLIVYYTTFTLGYLTQPRFLASQQQEIGREIRKRISEPMDVMVLNHPYMYQVAGLIPPNLDFRWPKPAFEYQNANGTRDKASYAVLMPGSDQDGQRLWLEEGGLELFASLSSPWNQPVLLFHRPD